MTASAIRIKLATTATEWARKLSLGRAEASSAMTWVRRTGSFYCQKLIDHVGRHVPADLPHGARLLCAHYLPGILVRDLRVVP
jgi:hypothetical protein